MKLIKVSTPNEARPPLHINIKGHDRLKRSNPIESIKSIYLSHFYFSFSLPYFSNPIWYSSLVSMVRGRPNWPAESTTIQYAQMRLPDEVPPERTSIKIFIGLPSETNLTALPNQSDWISWRRLCECTPRAHATARFSVEDLCWKTGSGLPWVLPDQDAYLPLHAMPTKAAQKSTKFVAKKEAFPSSPFQNHLYAAHCK